jgi:hypothetical protein
LLCYIYTIKFPASLAVNGDSEKVELLQSFWDQVLKKSPECRNLISLFYRHKHELASILNKYPRLLSRSKLIMEDIHPSLDIYSEEEIKLFIEEATILADDLLDSICVRASVLLRKDIDRYISDTGQDVHYVKNL